MASLLLMRSEEEIAERRGLQHLDAAQKDALLEIGSLIGASLNTAVAELGLAGWSARSEGCQGVRAGVRPAFPYEEGSELIAGRAAGRIAGFPDFELLLLLPPLG